MSVHYEKSCGAVVFTRLNGDIKYAIIQSLEGYYGFPKGHMEANESEEQTALREIHEETGLTVHILDGFRYVDEHTIPSKPGVIKQIIYFVAEFEGQDPCYQPEELLSIGLMSYTEAMNAFQWENSKKILAAADHFLHDKGL